jgi:hypothetical protein
VKYKIRFKTATQGFSGDPDWSFAYLPLDCWGTCSQCKTFPFCVVLRNSGRRYKKCPCQICVVKGMCVNQCDNFKKEVQQLFALESVSDYKHYWNEMLDR